MSLLFIVNPIAGKGKAKHLIPIIEKICREKEVEFEIKLTSEPKDGTTLGKWAVEKGFKRIVSVGGDGTLNEIVNGIAGSEVALGVIPGGSGNDFLRTIDVHREIEEVISGVIDGEARLVDLGRCNGRYFINVGSAGFDAEVAYGTQQVRRLFSGTTAYIVAALKTIFTYSGTQMRINVDDKIIEEKTLLIAIANGRYYGGGILPAPDADVEDGFFDICHVKKLWRPKIFVLMPKYIKGRHGDLKEVTFLRGKKIRIEAECPMAINLDGEIIRDSVVDFEMIEKGIRVIFPR
jgi:diacylglycerol kinase (ATP)